MVLSAIFGIIPPWLIKNVVDDVLIQKKLYMLNILCRRGSSRTSSTTC